MSMLMFKLSVVPLIIAAVSLAGRRWGNHIAGLLSGFPVVGGPITVFIAIEQGPAFGAQAAVAGIVSLVCLVGFHITYSWMARRSDWPGALAAAMLVWLLLAACLGAVFATLPLHLMVALALVLPLLAAAPRLFPPGRPAHAAIAKAHDLPLRMATGAALTLGLTAAAAQLGSFWSGMLAAFPVIGLVLVVFTHIGAGAGQVAFLVRGNVQGLYSFVAFFSVLALLWPHGHLWSAIALAGLAGIGAQAALQALQWVLRRLA